VFGDSAFSFGFSPKTTLADVADWVADVARVHHAAPVAVDVTLAAARPLRLSKGTSHGTH
jgi:hypothetical protein